MMRSVSIAMLSFPLHQKQKNTDENVGRGVRTVKKTRTKKKMAAVCQRRERDKK